MKLIAKWLLVLVVLGASQPSAQGEGEKEALRPLRQAEQGTAEQEPVTDEQLVELIAEAVVLRSAREGAASGMQAIGSALELLEGQFPNMPAEVREHLRVALEQWRRPWVAANTQASEQFARVLSATHLHLSGGRLNQPVALDTIIEQNQLDDAQRRRALRHQLTSPNLAAARADFLKLSRGFATAVNAFLAAAQEAAQAPEAPWVWPERVQERLGELPEWVEQFERIVARAEFTGPPAVRLLEELNQAAVALVKVYEAKRLAFERGELTPPARILATPVPALAHSL